MNIRQAFVGILLALATLTALAGKPESKGPDPDAILRQLYKAAGRAQGAVLRWQESQSRRAILHERVGRSHRERRCQARRRDWLN